MLASGVVVTIALDVSAYLSGVEALIVVSFIVVVSEVLVDDISSEVVFVTTIVDS